MLEALDNGNYPYLTPWTITLSLAYNTYASTHLYHIYYMNNAVCTYVVVSGVEACLERLDDGLLRQRLLQVDQVVHRRVHPQVGRTVRVTDICK